MWSKKNKEKEEKRVVTTTLTHHVTQTSQSVSVVRTFENRSNSVTIGALSPRDITPSSSMSRIDNRNFLPLPSSTTPKASSTTNLRRISTDAHTTTIPTKVNLNYQSPYRNSPVYSSVQYNRPNTISTGTSLPYRPPPSTNMAYRSALPATVVASTEPINKKIQVKKTGKFYDSSSLTRVEVPTYNTHSKNRGEVLIINNIMFKDKGYRNGAVVDDENLKTLFKGMGFKVSVHRDLKSSGMLSKVKNFSKQGSLRSADMAIVVVMSHGTKNTTLGGTEVFGLDEKGILVDEITEFFNEADCKYLADKPKIFIVQCCRGDNEQFIESDAQGIPAKKSALTNALIAYSSLPGFVSHRNPVSGTWYIRTMCDVFSQHAHEYHIEDLLKMVDVQLSGIASNIKQTTNYENRGFKRCYLHPM